MVDISKQTTGFYLPPKVSTKVFDDINQTNAFFKAAGGATPFSGDGEIMHAFENLEAKEVAETGIKTLSDITVSNVEALPRKFYIGLPFSDELEEDHPEIVDAIIRKTGPAIAAKIQAKILSTDTTPGFTSLGGLTAVPVNTRQELFSILSLVDGVDVGLVISNSYLADLYSRVNVGGNDEFRITRNAADMTTGYINEVPFYVFNSTEKVGYLADWKKNSAARKVKDVAVKFKYAGFQIDGADIAARNMFVALAEQRVTFVTSPFENAVIKIAPTATPGS